tara:strand:+ start:429 stop:587 length:159 start_codon:yes stop_codon:yes gene_type:complete
MESKKVEKTNPKASSKIAEEFALKPIEPTTKNYVCLNKFAREKAIRMVKRNR